MYVVTGATGNTGSVVAHTLLSHGRQVRTLGRNASRLLPFANRGAEALVIDLTDTGAVVRAFLGAEAAYVMIPPNPALPDYFAYVEKVVSSLASALVEARVRHAVVLSSLGAELHSGTGLVVGAHRLERTLDGIAGLNTLNLRAGYFMENTLTQVEAIHAMGKCVGPLRADLKLPMIAARDIGAVAAQALLELDFHGHQTRELHGQRDISYAEAASILGQAIDIPDLQYEQLSDERLSPVLADMGMSSNFIDLFFEMSAALNSGQMKALEPRNVRNTTPTTFESFVAEKFVPVYQKVNKAA